MDGLTFGRVDIEDEGREMNTELIMSRLLKLNRYVGCPIELVLAVAVGIDSLCWIGDENDGILSCQCRRCG